MGLKVLDCTLRDGGYYNKWDFELEVVKSYLRAMSEAKVDIVELGLRNFSQSQYLGAHAYTTEEYLASLELDKKLIYGVMIDAVSILNFCDGPVEAINKLFIDAKDSPISLVRVAAHFGELDECEVICKSLKNKGYMVGLNMMQAGGKSSDLITESSSKVALWDCVDVLYFADSIGNMDQTDVERILAAIKLAWSGEIGIHAHDNMNRAISNTLHAQSLGATWLDSTVCGMGRGAGNAQTEYLMASLLCQHYYPAPIYKLVHETFQTMKIEYGWGSNLLYFLGAQNNIHPTFVQTLISSPKYRKEDALAAIEYLSEHQNTFAYSNQLLNEAIDFGRNEVPVSGDTTLVGSLKDKTVLIAASGPSIIKHREAIERYIKKLKPVVFSVNIIDGLSPELIDYYLVTHNSKFISQLESYSNLSRKVILPKHRFTKHELSLFNSACEIIDYGFDIMPTEFEVHESYCSSPLDLTLSYALACSVVSGANKLKLVGFDGYTSLDSRQAEMLQLLEIFKSRFDIEIEMLTPSTYPLPQGSIYALNQ